MYGNKCYHSEKDNKLSLCSSLTDHTSISHRECELNTHYLNIKIDIKNITDRKKNNINIKTEETSKTIMLYSNINHIINFTYDMINKSYYKICDIMTDIKSYLFSFFNSTTLKYGCFAIVVFIIGVECVMISRKKTIFNNVIKTLIKNEDAKFTNNIFKLFNETLNQHCTTINYFSECINKHNDNKFQIPSKCYDFVELEKFIEESCYHSESRRCY
jgi:hypothetical protein